MDRLKKPLLSLLPYQQVTLLIPFTTEEVSQILMGVSITDLEVQAQSLWGTRIPYKYKVYIKDEFVKIEGPFGYRISPLLTQGKIQLNPSNGKAILQLTIRPENLSILQVIVGLGIYFGFIVVVFGNNGVLSSFILSLAFQILLIYSVLLYNFRYKVGLILQLLNQTFKL